MLRLEIPDDVLVRSVTDAVALQLQRVNDFAGYVDLKGACKFLSVGETQFKEWVKNGFIHARKVSTHLVRFRIDELRDFMDQFKITRPQIKPQLRVVPSPSAVREKTIHAPAAR
jgi:hypothetical protein